MLAALVNSGVPPSRPQSAEWYFDTGASSHMSSNAGNLSALQPVHTPTPIIIGNGDTLPVTHRARAQIATTRAPLYLDNILVSPSLVKNLISVRSLTHDNNVSIEFDPFGFSVKDLPTRVEILRCNNNGELYPLASSSPQALVTTAPTMELWRQHLGHPRRQDWKIIEQRIEKRLSGWKGKMLTSGGRLVLINSVLSSLPMFMMSFFELPKGVLQKIDCFRSRFFGRMTNIKRSTD